MGVIYSLPEGGRMPVNHGQFSGFGEWADCPNNEGLTCRESLCESGCTGDCKCYGVIRQFMRVDWCLPEQCEE